MTRPQLDLRDTPETTLALFGLVNFIAEEMITRPREIDRLYESLPESKREGIQQRDNRRARQQPESTAPPRSSASSA